MDIGTSSKYKKVNEDTLFYKAAWRWHFYAGIFVTPFMLILAVTGMIMMYIGYFDGRDGERVTVSIPPNAITLTLQEQSNIALATHPKGKLVEWIKASQPNRVNVFRIKDSDGSQSMVAVNPYNGEIVNEWLRRQGWYDLADDIHSDLLLGTIGDRILEIAAGFAIILIITGVYLCWPKDRKIRDSLIPKLSLKGRLFWKEVHVSLGVYVSIFFFLFLLSGMSWTGVWGGKLVQAWSTFPAQKWDNIPLSDETHASLNYGPSGGMPWAIEETPLPVSGSKLGVNGTLPNEAVNLDSIERLAQRIGFEGRYRVSFPKGNTGVWTINQDTMNSDAPNPFADKTVHVDRYTGHVLAKVTFDDYSFAGKTMAVSIPIHMGLVTIWNLIINTIICLSVIVLSITGVIMWWKRRPEKSGFKLVPPAIPSKLPHWHNAMIVMLALSLFFPLVGITLVCVLLLDMFILSRIPILKKIFK
ncbi:PepSY-associated TM helix domain-containing protein [Arcobacter sp.]|uniref:PepSY-associated TM helix domain-containing protein n=1 Tax=Arcobacter sp. TaxID=1872629 RepID=UPI003C730A4B